MDVEKILERIGYSGPREPDLAVLRALQNAFLLTVPFENLDIHRNEEIVLDLDRFYDKIVGRHRGGFCYECNGLFAELLKALGFQVTLVSARMALGGELGPEFDHMVILVALDQDYMVDVGNGQSARDPLPLDGSRNCASEGFEYHLGRAGEIPALLFRASEGEWQPRFIFSTEPRALADFAEMCVFHQTSPESVFTMAPMATMATPEGRITLAMNKLGIVEPGETQDRMVPEDEMDDVLKTYFQIDLTDA